MDGGMSGWRDGWMGVRAGERAGVGAGKGAGVIILVGRVEGRGVRVVSSQYSIVIVIVGKVEGRGMGEWGRVGWEWNFAYVNGVVIKGMECGGGVIGAEWR